MSADHEALILEEEEAVSRAAAGHELHRLIQIVKDIAESAERELLELERGRYGLGVMPSLQSAAARLSEHADAAARLHAVWRNRAEDLYCYGSED